MGIGRSPSPRGTALVILTALFCLGIGIRVASAQDACSEVTISGFEDGDGFPADGSVFVNVEEPGVRGNFVEEGNAYHIWYAAGSPDELSVVAHVTSTAICTGFWVFSTYPLGTTFDDLVWYQSSEEEGCALHPSEVSVGGWKRVGRSCAVCVDGVEEVSNVSADCPSVEEEGGGGSGGSGVSDETVVAIVAVVGAGAAILMCLGALACCVKSSPPTVEGGLGDLGNGELRSNSNSGSGVGGSIIGDTAGPGIHAHPETGVHQPHPHGRAPSFSQGSIEFIGRGSTTGPSVRSIVYE